MDLILSGTPNIVNVQVTPDLENRQARVRVWLKNAAAGDVTAAVREAKSETNAGMTSARLTAAAEQTLDMTVPLANCHPWAPEDPFLYEITVRTAGDEFTTRFGMRTFKLDPATGRAILNGKPYFMRGSNLTLYRFFEDPDCGGLPWQDEWVRTLHRRVKNMHWNCLRYCIGFPPEAWYRIADEEGILIQDEFPIWNMEGGKAAAYNVDRLAGEYREWMQERWNHPCVVIWDACNETRSTDVAKAFTKVRGLDMSNRPWDNGWQPPQDPGDCFESHPYHFINSQFTLADLAKADPASPGNIAANSGGNAVVINEYAWLWLNRDGTPTTLTSKLYENLLGKDSTTAQRRHLYARYLAAETEFWRCHRKAAAVMHFTTLGYSRPDGQTSDHWLDVPGLKWEPEFYQYVRDSFAPVGLMIDAWAKEYPAGKPHEFPVVVINDLYENWSGTVRVRLTCDGALVKESVRDCEIPALGDVKLVFPLDLPAKTGDCQLEAALVKSGTDPVRSLRDFSIITDEQRDARRGIAVGKPVKASSNVKRDGATTPEAAVDGRAETRWSSEASDPQWLAVNLEKPVMISRVTLDWEAAYGKVFTIDVSLDGETWNEVFSTQDGHGGSENIKFPPVEARWVRMHGTQRGTQFGYSLWEFKVFKQGQ